jgi:hypothetical protein
VRLYENNRERERWETLADIYSLFVTVEHLEKAYIRDAIPADAYAIFSIIYTFMRLCIHAFMQFTLNSASMAT